ncbi:hypothetical protein D3C72_1422300 [compost metagenome]
MAVRAQTAGGLRQYRQQCGFGMRKLRGRFAQIGPAGRFHAFDGATVGRALQIQRKDLALGQVHFQLHRTQHLLQLAPGGACMRIQNARDLHGQGRATGDDAATAQQLPAGTQDRQRIDARMLPEPAILVGQQRLQVQRRDAVDRRRIAPHALGVGERTQRTAVSGNHQRAGIALLRQRWRKDDIQHQQQRQQCRGAPAQPRP